MHFRCTQCPNEFCSGCGGSFKNGKVTSANLLQNTIICYQMSCKIMVRVSISCVVSSPSPLLFMSSFFWEWSHCVDVFVHNYTLSVFVLCWSSFNAPLTHSCPFPPRLFGLVWQSWSAISVSLSSITCSLLPFPTMQFVVCASFSEWFCWLKEEVVVLWCTVISGLRVHTRLANFHNNGVISVTILWHLSPLQQWDHSLPLQACGKFEACKDKGLHAHHPRDCLYYLRDFGVKELQKLLTDNQIKFDIGMNWLVDTVSLIAMLDSFSEPPQAQVDAVRAAKEQGEEEGVCAFWLFVPLASLSYKAAGGEKVALHCRVMLQKEKPNGLTDEECGNPSPEGMAGLCTLVLTLNLHYQLCSFVRE